MSTDPFGAAKNLETAQGRLTYFSSQALARSTDTNTDLLPHTVKILLENLLRRAGTRDVPEEDVRALAAWPAPAPGASLAFMPSRVLMQDFTGVPAVVDLAALRSAVERVGGDPKLVNPFVPVDLVIDHSVTVEGFGSPRAYGLNIEWEYKRNQERYAL